MLVAALLFAGTAAMAWFGACLGLRLSDNVHVVESGVALRSGQLWPAELEIVIADYGIRSIISSRRSSGRLAGLQKFSEKANARAITTSSPCDQATPPGYGSRRSELNFPLRRPPLKKRLSRRGEGRYNLGLWTDRSLVGRRVKIVAARL
jgi:hypothetical protein